MIEQVKTLGKDTDLLAETLAESCRQREEAIGKLEVEKRTLERELHRHSAELRKLAGKDGPATDHMADIQDRNPFRWFAGSFILRFLSLLPRKCLDTAQSNNCGNNTHDQEHRESNPARSPGD